MYFLYKFLLTVLHVLYSCAEMLTFVWIFVRKKYESVWYKSDVTEELAYISNYVKNLGNIPSHVAFILVNEKISCEDLANIVIWSLAAGISFLSFYDSDGKLKQNEEKLQKEVYRKKGYGDYIIWGRRVDDVVHKNGTNGFKPRRPVRVSLLSREDGFMALVKAAQQLGTSKSILSGGERLSVHQVEQVLAEEDPTLVPLPDPELAVWCGRAACNAGFLPWHIRVTEFLQLQTHRGLSARDFLQLLHRYGKCEQRFGK